MYQIKPYALRTSFRYLPAKKRYSVLFYIGKSVTFSNYNKAQDFIKSINKNRSAL
jgi:hypothetical protein